MLKKFVFVLGCVMLSYGAASAETLFVRDSTGLKTQNGKTYITHKVTPGESLYGLARKYGVAVNKIVEANKNIDKALIIGQTVLIPIATGNTSTASAANTPAETSVTSPAANRTYVVDAKGNKIHTVQARQTMFSIANQHNVSIEDLQKWNKLTTSTVKIGQKLIVGVGEKAPSQAASNAKVYTPEADDVVTSPKQPANAPASSPTVATTTKTSNAGSPKGDAEEEKPASKTTEYVSRVNESGMAEQIDTRTEANKFLALHRSAPVGTIMAVKNPMNDQTVYVRVIGKLPATGENDKVVVKLSKKACQQIGAVDKRFRVEVSYMP